MRSARLELLEYKDGEKRYIIAPVGVNRWARRHLQRSDGPARKSGMRCRSRRSPSGASVHNIEIVPGHGGQMVRSAGGAATLMSRTTTGCTPSYACRRVKFAKFSGECYATIGQVGNTEHENVILGKAGRSRHRGIRGISRGVARNPVDHPNGGGAGKSKSGGGWQQLMSAVGQRWPRAARRAPNTNIQNRFI